MDHHIVQKKLAIASAGIAFGLIAALLFSVLIDRVTGYVLNRTGYFTALMPNSTWKFDVKDFESIATISAQGIRNPYVTTPKPDGTYRILALGDSFTFGWGVSRKEAWPAQVEQSLKIPGKKIEVINAGAPGMGIFKEADTCLAYADRFDVDAILVGLFGSDDYYQAGSRAQRQSLIDQVGLYLWPTLLRVKSPVLTPSWGDTDKPGEIAKISSIWKEAATSFYKDNPGISDVLEPAVLNDFLQGQVNPTFIIYALQDPGYLIKMLEPLSRAKALTAYKSQFQRLMSCAGKRPVILVFLPSNMAVSANAFTYRKALGFAVDSRMLTFDFDEMVRDVALAYRIPYISLLSDFRRDGCPGCYYPWDRHMTAVGNKRAAGIITPILTDMSGSQVGSDMGLSKHSLFFIIGIIFSLIGLWYVTSGVDYGFLYSLDYTDVIVFSALGIGILICYLFADLLGKETFRWICVIGAIACLVVIPTMTSIHHRLMTKPYYYVHDNPIQMEEAVKMVLAGKDPYGADYSNTPMGQFSYGTPVYDFAGTPEPSDTKINPALHHTVSLPFGIIAVIPWYIAWDALFYWFDARIVYLVAYLALITIAAFLVPKANRIDFVPLFALNPLLGSFVIEGHNDTLVMVLVVATLVLAQRKKFVLSAIPLGLAVATKQSSWPFALIYTMYVWMLVRKTSRVAWVYMVGLAVGIALICIAPFFLLESKGIYS